MGFGVLLFIFVPPMPFLTSFEIVNESGSDIWVTPIGLTESGRWYAPLPLYEDNADRPYRLPKKADIPLRAAGTLEITYDWDDINFRHILVRGATGDLYLVDTDKMGAKHRAYAAQQKVYAIPPLKDLHEAPEALLPCLSGERVEAEYLPELPGY